MSCVDDAVSPQVEAIREQQVEFMKAKTGTELAMADLEKANTAFRAAEAVAKELENSLNKEQNVFTLKERQLAFDLAGFTQEQAIFDAKADLEKAKLNLIIALSALEAQVANAKDDKAIAYFGNYKVQADDLAALYTKRGTNSTDLAKKELAILNDVDVVKNYRDNKNAEIKYENTLLVAEQASLKIQKSVIENQTNVNKEIDALELTNDGINKSIASKKIDLAKANNDVELAKKAYNTNNDIIAKITANEAKLVTLTKNVNSLDITIYQSKRLNDSLTTDLLRSRSLLSNYVAIYEQFKADFKDKVSVYTLAELDYDQKLVVFNLKEKAEAIAKFNYSKNSSKENADILTNAVKELDSARSAEVKSKAALVAATKTMNEAAKPYQTYKLTVEAQEKVVSDDEIAIANVQKNLLVSENSKLSIEREATELKKDIAADKLTLATPIKIEEYKNALTDKLNISEKISDEIKNLEVPRDVNVTLIGELKKLRAGGDLDLNLKKTETAINVLVKKIADLNTDLSGVTTVAQAKAKLQAELEHIKKQIAINTAQIDAKEKLAKYWKDMLDNAIKAL